MFPSCSVLIVESLQDGTQKVQDHPLQDDFMILSNSLPQDRVSVHQADIGTFGMSCVKYRGCLMWLVKPRIFFVLGVGLQYVGVGSCS